MDKKTLALDANVLSFQVDEENKEQSRNTQSKGDGITTAPENFSEEELDYEDDLSIDDGFEVLTVDDDHELEQVDSDKQPSCSLQNEVVTEKGSNLDLSKLTEDQLMSNPILQRMMQKIFNDQFKNIQKGDDAKGETGDVSNFVVTGKTKNRDKEIKSPSDTTIYAPTLQRKLNSNDRNCVRVDVALQLNTHDELWHTTGLSRPIDSMDHEQNNGVRRSPLNVVSNFVESMRLEQHPDDHVRRRSDVMAAAELEEAHQRAQKIILEAEKFPATVERPGGLNTLNTSGMGNSLNPMLVANNASGAANNYITKEGNNLAGEQLLIQSNGSQFNMLDIGSGVSDDDFFHLTCHIEPNLIHKIEKGEFVKLEKLLPKDKLGSKEENKLEWVQRDGGTFLVPAQRDNKIYKR